MPRNFDRYLWAKLTQASKAPLPDIMALNPDGSVVYHANDPRLDILLTSARRAATTIAGACDGSARGAYVELTPFNDDELRAPADAIIAAYPVR